jgi:tetratricopeptide (TPR) repeat protein
MLKIFIPIFIGFILVNFNHIDAKDFKLQIHNRVKHPTYARPTNINAGTDVGGILNAHYFPGLIDYKNGNYVGAKNQMDYFLDRPHYTKENPRQAEFFSNGHYIRGIIYFYHASGRGKYIYAKKDFEQSIRWNPKNYAAYLQLSRVLSKIGEKKQAVSILYTLIDSKPKEEIIQLFKKEISTIKYKKNIP